MLITCEQRDKIRQDFGDIKVNFTRDNGSPKLAVQRREIIFNLHQISSSKELHQQIKTAKERLGI